MNRLPPPATTFFVGLCSALFVVQILFDVELPRYTLCPRFVLYLHQYYRLVTSAFLHANFMHLAMNMISTVAISSMLERHLGTLRHFITTMWAVLFSSSLVVLIAAAAFYLVGIDALMLQHGVGFSAVLFHMLVLECAIGGAGAARSVFGLVTVPAFVYPWIL